jgi:hypothetical protein
MDRITGAEMLPGYRLRLRFADGAEGVADLAHLVAMGGVYAVIAAAPDAVRIGEYGRSVEWRGEDGEPVDFCADALRLEIDARRAAAGSAGGVDVLGFNAARANRA